MYENDNYDMRSENAGNKCLLDDTTHEKWRF